MTSGETLGYTHDKTPQRAARARATQLRQWAKGLRDFVAEGKVENYQLERRSKSGKILRHPGTRQSALTEEKGRKLIHEAERMELLADLTLEQLGIRE